MANRAVRKNARQLPDVSVSSTALWQQGWLGQLLLGNGGRLQLLGQRREDRQKNLELCGTLEKHTSLMLQSRLAGRGGVESSYRYRTGPRRSGPG